MIDIVLCVVIIFQILLNIVFIYTIFLLTKLNKANTLEEYTAHTVAVESKQIVQKEEDEQYMSIDDTPASWLQEAVNSKNNK